MRILIEVEGGCIVGVQADTEHEGPLEVVRVDADCREQGDDAVEELAYAPVTPAQFDGFLEAERAKDATMGNEDEIDLSKPCWTIAETSITPEQEEA